MTVTSIWTLGERMGKARRLAGLEAADLADRLGVSTSTVSRWENDHGPVLRRDLMAYGVVTGLRWEWLETGEGEPYAAAAGTYPPVCARDERPLAAAA